MHGRPPRSTAGEDSYRKCVARGKESRPARLRRYKNDEIRAPRADRTPNTPVEEEPVDGPRRPLIAVVLRAEE